MEIGIVRKIIGCVLALLLALGVVPVGLFYFATPVIAEDSIIRLSPIDETFVYSGADNKNRARLDSECLIVGNYWDTYLKFDLTSLGNVKRADLRSAKLRLAVIDNGAFPPDNTDCSFNVSYLDNDSWNDDMTWNSKPAGEEQYLCTASGAAGGSALEIDLTEFVRGTAGDEDKIITLKLSPSLSNSSPLRLASTAGSDPTCRPFLKITVGDVSDGNTADLSKSFLSDSGYVSQAEPDAKASELLERNNGILAVDNGSAAYLKFGLNLRNIIGAVTNAEIFLRPVSGSANTKINVYYFENDNWNSSTVTFGAQPEGERTEVRTFNGIETDGGLRVDVTDIVYDAVSRGKTLLSFIIDGTETPPESTDSVGLYSAESGSGAPELRISCTDDKDIVAIREALANLAGSNSGFDNVTTDLPSEYTAANGERVNIRWSISENFSLEELLTLRRRLITTAGKVNPPSIFEGAREVQAKAELSCGGNRMQRFILMTIPPDTDSTGRLKPLYDALWKNN